MKRIFGVLTAVALTAVVNSAQAQGVDEFGPYGGKEEIGRPSWPLRFAVELRFGPYEPRVDEAVSGSPYTSTFGDGTRYFGGFEVDWQVLRIPKLLSLGPGVAFHYTKSTGNARVESTGELSGEETSLTILPMYAAAVLRIDALADNTPLPLVPYAKLGLGYALWWSDDGGETARHGDTVGKDNSYGYMAAGGLMFRLDFLDPDAANTARADAGLAHSYLFGEWHASRLDGFGSNSSMDVGTDTWVVGLSLEGVL